MTLRKIDEHIELPDLASFQAAHNKYKWESIDCHLVTPIYGGGVKSATPDDKQPVRVAAIRGQLRFWWRLLAQHKWKLSVSELSELRKQEFALWGGMNDGDENGKASLVFLRVKNVKFANEKSKVEPYTKYVPTFSSILNYVLFPARPVQQTDPVTHLLSPDLTWTLEWRVDEKRISDAQKEQVIETLRWWVNFGGIGARTRRGCGAFIAKQSTQSEILKPISADEIQAAQCQLATVNANNAMTAWEIAVKKLRDFRQGVNVGRNPSSNGGFAGRSRWTEPDAIRRLTNRHSSLHAPEHRAGNQFPRGMFGMPIIFHFVGNEEPQDTSLQPVGKERMSSPVIIRPIQQNGQWQAAALLLPHDFSQLRVELKQVQEVTLFDKNKVNEIKPIHDNGGTNPLDAFMAYFIKK